MAWPAMTFDRRCIRTEHGSEAIDGIGCTTMTFNLRLTILTLVTLLCLLPYLVAAAPPVVAAFGLFAFLTLQTTFFLAGAVYGRENLKAFCRGALLPALLHYSITTWLVLAYGTESFLDAMEIGSGIVDYLRVTTVVSAVVSVLGGLAMVVFKRLVEPRRPNPPAE